MRLYASIHVLGSVSGYQTLAASPDVTAEEVRHLETLGFGQTDRPDYHASLEQRPSAIGRPLPTGRYAVTRCFAGQPDSAGRRTLLFATLIFTGRDWVDQVSRCLPELVQDGNVWGFRHRTDGKPVQVTLPDATQTIPPRELTLAVMDAWLNCDSRRALVLLPDEDRASRSVLGIPPLLPARQRARVAWGLRVLSSGAPVSLATAEAGAEQGGRRRIIRPRIGASAQHGYVGALEMFWKPDQPPPKGFCDRVEDVSQVRTLVQGEGDTAAADADPTTQWSASRKGWWQYAAMGGGLVLVLAVVVSTMGWMLGRDESEPTSPPAPETGVMSNTSGAFDDEQDLAAEGVWSLIERFDSEEEAPTPDGWESGAQDQLERLEGRDEPAARVFRDAIAGRLSNVELRGEWLDRSESWLEGTAGLSMTQDLEAEALVEAHDRLADAIRSGDELIHRHAAAARNSGWGQARLDEIEQRRDELGGAKQEVEQELEQRMAQELAGAVDPLADRINALERLAASSGAWNTAAAEADEADDPEQGRIGRHAAQPREIEGDEPEVPASVFGNLDERHLLPGGPLREWLEQIEELTATLEQRVEEIREQRQRDIDRLAELDPEGEADEDDGEGGE